MSFPAAPGRAARAAGGPRTPTVTVVVPAYNAQEFVAQSLTAILSQTRPADEVIVVDDGSTDGTHDVLRRFAGDIRIVRQENRGHPGAYNTGFGEARGDYVARCDADDIWEPMKLERQVDGLRRHPEVDIAFCAARFFGLVDGPYGISPGEGVLVRRAFASTLYRANIVCSSSVLVRRRLFERLGPFVEKLPCEDYDFWLRAFVAGAVFYFERETLVRYRRHEQQVTHDLLRMRRATHMVHRWHAGSFDDRRLVQTVLANDLCDLARLLVDEDRPHEARMVFVDSLRRTPTPFGLAWTLILSVPDRYRRALAGGAISLKRSLSSRLR
jgi:glycosyltransferase involved in cell wall biosynthesis